eukprot:3167203-Prymnesium_polylepis.1
MSAERQKQNLKIEELRSQVNHHSSNRSAAQRGEAAARTAETTARTAEADARTAETDGDARNAHLVTLHELATSRL